MKIGCRVALGVGLATLTYSAPSAKTLDQFFAHPPAEAQPRARWWWPGGAVADVELKREIAAMKKAGFGGAEIQPFNPGILDLTDNERATINDYATPAFFAHVKSAADAARIKGMSLDYTFGSAWPSGGGFAITPELAMLELTMGYSEVQGGGQGAIKLPDVQRTRRFGAFSSLDPRSRDPRIAGWPARMAARSKIVAVLAVKGGAPNLKRDVSTGGLKLFPWSDVSTPGQLQQGSVIVLTDKIKAEGTLDWNPPAGTWQLFVFKQYVANTSVMGAVGEGPQLVLDHMNKSAFAAHAGRVGDPFVNALDDSLGGVRSTFIDSLELFQDIPWTDDFLTQFKVRRGYDLTPYLPFVLQPGWMQPWDSHWSPGYFEGDDSVARRVRADYRQTVSDLMLERFVEPFVDWNHAHGLKAKFQAHGGPLDIIKGYGLADIPETEDLAGADPYFMRFARSAADIYGRRIVSAESLVWAGRPYSVTLDELRKRADLIFSGGVNAIMEHGVDYRFHADRWPGWHAFQPSAFTSGFSTMLTESNPIWAGLPQLNGYIARTSAVLQQGQSIVPVAVFYGEIGYYVGIEDQGSGKQALEKSLLAGGYDFDRINPDGLLNARIEGGRLVTPGGARFAALVLPKNPAISAIAAERIARFAHEGLPVLFVDGPPERDVTLKDWRAADKRVQKAVLAILSAGGRVEPEAALVATLRDMGAPANLRFTGADANGLMFVQRRVGDKTVTFLRNSTGNAKDASLVLPGRGGVERWNAMDGTRLRLVTRAVGDGVVLPLHLDGDESALLVQDAAFVPARISQPGAVSVHELPATGWALALDGHGPGGASIVRQIGDVALGDWRKSQETANFSGRGAYHIGFSLNGRWIGRRHHVVLDLGEVHDMATVALNGCTLAPLITTPYRVDVTKCVRRGVNDLVVTVANTPNNAMLDSKMPGFRNPVSAPAGLLGPVKVELH
jgi:hypothetical protein